VAADVTSRTYTNCADNATSGALHRSGRRSYLARRYAVAGMVSSVARLAPSMLQSLTCGWAFFSDHPTANELEHANDLTRARFCFDSYRSMDNQRSPDGTQAPRADETYQLDRLIGKGGFGEVYLANAHTRGMGSRPAGLHQDHRTSFCLGPARQYFAELLFREVACTARVSTGSPKSMVRVHGIASPMEYAVAWRSREPWLAGKGSTIVSVSSDRRSPQSSELSIVLHLGTGDASRPHARSTFSSVRMSS